MPTAAEVKAINQVKFVSYAFNVPPFALWIGLLARVLINKDRRKLVELIVICTLMILN